MFNAIWNRLFSRKPAPPESGKKDYTLQERIEELATKDVLTPEEKWELKTLCEQVKEPVIRCG